MEPSTAHLFLTIEALILALGHYIPHWIKVWGKLEISNPKRLIFNYVYGVTSIIGSFVWWLETDVPTDPHLIGRYLIGFAVVAGMTVAGLYLIDTIRNNSDRLKVEQIKNAHHQERLNNGEADRTR